MAVHGRLSLTLSFYLARRYFAWFLGVSFVVTLIVYVASLIELMRRAAKLENVSLAVALQMAGLKVPSAMQDVFPFLVLASAIGAYWQLTRTSETVVARASGVSAWQFLLPAGLVAMLIGLFRVFVFDPVAAVTAVSDERMEQKYFDRDITLVASAANGLWLRTRTAGEDRIIHAAEVQPKALLMRDVMILSFGGNNRFAGRIDAGSASVQPGVWVLHDVREVRPNEPTVRRSTYRFPTAVSVEDIVHTLSAASTLSFFELPRYIRLLEQTGFSARPHRVRYNRLLATPIEFLGMFFLGTAFSLRPHRFGGTAAMIGLGAASGFVFYFVSRVIYNLGHSTVPPEVAAWTPAAAITMIGVSMLLHLEDG
ncbi:MAG: LPS export ABC transporter permease LptG [Rhodospirillaceae bacterium]|nr:LPS export ABC transporter permease LptG [Rhodospirillaceae bacterium]